MLESAVLVAFADAFEAAAFTLRQRSALFEMGSESVALEEDAVSIARAMHPMLGPRQAQVIRVLEEHRATGTNTGVISRTINYDQPNVYLTLQGLITLGFAQKDETASPHLYQLSPVLLRSSADTNEA